MSSLRSFGMIGFALATAFVLTVLVFFYTPVRDTLRSSFAAPDRQILSIAVGRVIPDLGNARVAKVLTRDGLFVEVYGPPDNGFEPLIDRIKLPDRRDAFMQFQGRATNLAIQDMRGDQHYEIIAPSYDESLVPHLNIYQYNSSIGRFVPYENP